MAQLFTWLYSMFEKRRWALLIAVISILGLAGFFVSKIKLQEDITKAIPVDEKTRELNFIFQNSGLMDKLTFNVSLNDSNRIEPDKLVAFTDELADSLKTALFPDYIREISYKIDESIMNEGYDNFYNNLPLFLKQNDYLKIDSMLSEDQLDKTLKSNYRMLLSPANMMMKKFIIRDPLSLTPIVLKRLEELKVDDNFEIYNNHIFTNSRQNLLLFLTTANPGRETARNAELIERMDTIISKVTANYDNDISVEYFGSAAVSVCNAKRLKTDIIITVAIALVVLIIFISLFFRKLSSFFLIFSPAVFGGIVALAILYLIKGELSAIALGIGAVLLGITVDYSLHLFAHFRSKGNIRTVIKDLSPPVLMSSLTTASAFFCLVFLHSEALFDLGLFASISVICAALFSIIVLPHLINKKKNPENKVEDTTRKSILDKIVSYEFDRKKWLIIGIIIISAGLYYTTRFVEFESDMTRLGYLSDDLIKAEQNLDDLINFKLRSVIMVSEGKDLQEALRKTEKAQTIIDSLIKTGVVKSSLSVSGLLLSDSLQMERISQWKNFWTTQRKYTLKKHMIEKGSEYKFKETAFTDFYNLLDNEPQVSDLKEFNDMIDMLGDKFIIKDTNHVTLLTFMKVAREDKPVVYEAFNTISYVTISDQEFITNKFVDILKDDFNLLVIVSLIVVFIILVLSFGRIELALITFIPIVISWLWTIGIMGALGIKFTIFSVIISTFIFGLGIDYCIFISRGLLQEYKYGYKNLNSYKTSIFLSVITTITGIGVLILAKHPALQSIALLSVIGILSVVFISFTIQPLVFRWVISHKDKLRRFPVTLFIMVYAFVCYGFFLIAGQLTMLLGYTVLRLIPSNRIWKRTIHFLLCYLSRATMYMMFLLKKKIINPNNEKFKKPALIVCNHQSLIDIPMALMLTPKLIILTADWVQTSLVSGLIAKTADFYSVTLGPEELEAKLKEKVKDGYSIFVFPEGTRSKTGKIKRFHKGAFLLAQNLNIDILPIVMHGTGHYISKKNILATTSILTIKFLDRITPESTEFGTTYQERSKKIVKLCREEHEKMMGPYRTTEFSKPLLIKNYIYKGPILEWYLKVKLKMENNYSIFNDLVPRKAVVTDLGCGYGFLSHMLALVSEDRTVTGVDYDEEKVLTARNCAINRGRTNFICEDISLYQPEKSDVFIVSDTLHYLPENEQKTVIVNCIKNLNPDGTIIIKDGNVDLRKKHAGTKYTEFWSTKFGFNKTKNKLCFTSRSKITEIVNQHNMGLEVVESSKFTSNEIYVIRALSTN